LGIFDRFDVERTFVAPAISGLVTAAIALAAVAFLGPLFGLFPGVGLKTEKSDESVSGRQARTFVGVFKDQHPDWYNSISE
jgi:hypothetical protein